MRDIREIIETRQIVVQPLAGNDADVNTLLEHGWVLLSSASAGDPDGTLSTVYSLGRYPS